MAFGDALAALARRTARLTQQKSKLGLDRLNANNGLSAAAPVVTSTGLSRTRKGTPRAAAPQAYVPITTSTQRAKPVRLKGKAPSNPYADLTPTPAQKAALRRVPDPVMTPRELFDRATTLSGDPRRDPSSDFATGYGEVPEPQNKAFKQIQQKTAHGATPAGRAGIDPGFDLALPFATKVLDSLNRGASTGIAYGVGMNLPPDVQSGIVDATQSSPALTYAPMFIPGNPTGMPMLYSMALEAAKAGMNGQGSQYLDEQRKGLVESVNPLGDTRTDLRTGKQVPMTLADRALAVLNLAETIRGGLHGVDKAGGGKVAAKLGIDVHPLAGLKKDLGIEPGKANLTTPKLDVYLQRAAEEMGATIKADGTRDWSTRTRKGQPRNAGKIDVGVGAHLGRKKGPNPDLASPEDIEQFRHEDGAIHAVPIMGDRAGVHDYVAEDGSVHRQYGGPEYGKGGNLGRVVWSSAGAVTDSRLTASSTQSKGLGVITVGSKDGSLTSHGPRAYAAEIEAAVKLGKTTPERAVDTLRDAFEKAGMPLAQVEHLTLPVALELLRTKKAMTGARGGTFENVGKVVKLLGTKGRTEALGVPTQERIVQKINAPQYHDLPNNSAVAAVYSEPGVSGRASDFGVEPHPDYEFVQPGMHLGDTKPLALHDIASRDFGGWKSRQDEAFSVFQNLPEPEQRRHVETLVNTPKRYVADVQREIAQSLGVDHFRIAPPRVEDWYQGLRYSKRAVRLDPDAATRWTHEDAGATRRTSITTPDLAGRPGEAGGRDLQGVAGPGEAGPIGLPSVPNREGLARPESSPNANSSHVFVSPNTETGLDVHQAIARASEPGYVDAIRTRVKEALRNVTSRTTGNPVPESAVDVRPAVGDWSDGAEHSSIVKVDGLDRDGLRAVGAKLGRDLGQTDVLTFRAEAGGDHDLATVSFPKEYDTLAARQALADSGIEFRTLSQGKDGSVEAHVYVGERGTADHQSVVDSLHRLYDEHPVDVGLTEGHGEFLTGEWEDRAIANAKYDAILSDYAKTSQEYKATRDAYSKSLVDHALGRGPEPTPVRGGAGERYGGPGPDLAQQYAERRPLKGSGASRGDDRVGRLLRPQTIRNLEAGIAETPGIRTTPEPPREHEFELTHYSNGNITGDRGWVDPQFAFTGRAGTERSDTSYKTGWFYVEGLGAHEKGIVDGNPYRVVVDKSMLYDASADPEGFVAQEARSGVHGSPEELKVAVEKRARDAGWLGVYRPDNSVNPGAARTFVKLPVRRVKAPVDPNAYGSQFAEHIAKYTLPATSHTTKPSWIAPDGTHYPIPDHTVHGNVAAKAMMDMGVDVSGMRWPEEDFLHKGWVRNGGRGGIQVPDTGVSAKQLEAIKRIEAELGDVTVEPTDASGNIVTKDIAYNSRRIRTRRDQGYVDVRLLAGIGVAGGLTAYALQSQDVKDWLKSQGAAGLLQGGTVALATLGFLYGARKGKGLKVSPETIEATALFLSPREIGARGKTSADFGTSEFGKAVSSVVSAQGERLYRTGQALSKIDSEGKRAFGSKKWTRTEAFKQWNSRVRDVMETNVNEGREWYEGLPKEWRQFVESIQETLNDPANEFEALGGRVFVRNDGSQHQKLTKGDILIMPNGQRVRFVDYERPNASEPFTAGPSQAAMFGEDPAADARLAAGGKQPDGKIPTLIVEAVDGTNPQRSQIQADLVARRAEATGNPIGSVPSGTRMTIKPNEQFGRPIYREGHSFVPRILSSDLVERLRLGKMEAAEREALAQSIRDNHPEWGDVRTDEAIGWMTDIAESMGQKKGVGSFLHNLEQERSIGLAKYEYVNSKGETVVVDPYESSYVDAIGTYIDRSNKRVAIMRQFGSRPSSLASAIEGIANPDYRAYVEKLIGRTIGIGPGVKNPKAFWNRVAQGEGAFQTLTKLTTGGTHFAQLNDVTLSVTEAGLPRTLRALVDLATDHDGIRHESDMINAIHSNWLRDLQGVGNEEGAPTKPGVLPKLGAGLKSLGRGQINDGLAHLADGVMTAIQMRSMDKAVKRVIGATVLRDAEWALTQAASKKGLLVSGSDVHRKLERYGLLDQVQRARKEGVQAVLSDRKVVEQFAGAVREGFQYSGAAEDLPLWFSSGGGSITMRFKKPMYVTTRFLIRNVAGELAHGNVLPLIRLVTLGVGVGTAAGYGKDLLKLDGLDDETRALWSSGDYGGAIKRFFGLPLEHSTPAQAKAYVEAALRNDPEKGKALAQMLWTGGKALYDGGGLGVFGDLNPAWNRRVQSMSGSPVPEVSGMVLPLSLQTITNGLVHFFAADSEFPEERKAQLQAEATDELRQEIPLVRRLLDWMPQYKPAILQLRDLEGKENQLLNRMPPAERKDMKGFVLTPEEYAQKAVLTEQTKGLWNEIRGMQNEKKPRSMEDQAFGDLGVTKSGVREKPRKGTPRAK